MRAGWMACLLVLALAAASGCGSSDEGDGGGGGGFSERDRQAAQEFSDLKATSPALESLSDGLLYYARHYRLTRARSTLRKLRRSAKRFRRLVPKFDDPRARSAMTDFADGSAGVASAYAKVVGFIAQAPSSLRRLYGSRKRLAATRRRIYVTVRELDASIDETNAADRRLSNLEAPS
jgi:hypothetical protein